MILLHNFFHWQRCYKAQLQFIQCNPLTRGSLFLGLLIDVHTWQFPSGLPTDRQTGLDKIKSPDWLGWAPIAEISDKYFLKL